MLWFLSNYCPKVDQVFFEYPFQAFLVSYKASKELATLVLKVDVLDEVGEVGIMKRTLLTTTRDLILVDSVDSEIGKVLPFEL